jgi:AraC-like DNA-binding protein
MSIEQRLEILEQRNVPSSWIKILGNYYRKITCLSNEDGLVAALNTLGDVLWGEEQYTSESCIQGLPASLDPLGIPTDLQNRSDVFSNISAIEGVYRAENEILQAVSRGRSAKAKQLLSVFPSYALEQRTEGARNLQNYTIVLNTLLRKAAEAGGVHPLYIDQLSSSFARRIEGPTRTDNFADLWSEMIQKYCLLVNRHSIQKYSLPIQKILTRIDFDLAADLSLKANAEYLNVNSSYLSNLFKKETGYTLTDYVNMKRMEHAAYLLANTNTPVSSIAQTCGILDDNYFSKLFKKYYHKPPSKFRQDYYLIRS